MPCTIQVIPIPQANKIIYVCAENKLLNSVTVTKPNGTETKYIVEHFKAEDKVHPKGLAPVGKFVTSDEADKAARAAVVK